MPDIRLCHLHNGSASRKAAAYLENHKDRELATMATANMLQRTQQPKASAGDPYDSGDEDENVRRFNLNTTLPSQKYMADLLAICTGIGVTEEEVFPELHLTLTTQDTEHFVLIL